MPVTLVWLVTFCVSHRLKPCRVKNVPSVTMKLGRPDFTTMNPFRKPIARAMRSESPIAGQTLRPVWTANSPANIPVVPVITPADKSNSPPIISSATAMAVSPKFAEASRYVAVPAQLSHVSPPCQANKSQTTSAPASAPNSGRTSSRFHGESRAMRSSVVWTTSAAVAVVAVIVPLRSVDIALC